MSTSVPNENGNPSVQKGFIIFRTGTESGLSISYGGATPTALTAQSGFTIYSIPKEANWKIARFDFTKAPVGGQVVKIESTQSAFALGYITGHTQNNDCYAYFSAYGFELPDTTWMCGSSVTLEGGYAMSYLWTFPDNSTATTPSITATQEGVYTLKMYQDSNEVTASTYVRPSEHLRRIGRYLPMASQLRPWNVVDQHRRRHFAHVYDRPSQPASPVQAGDNGQPVHDGIQRKRQSRRILLHPARQPPPDGPLPRGRTMIIHPGHLRRTPCKGGNAEGSHILSAPGFPLCGTPNHLPLRNFLFPLR
jgi:hypothetical protein